MRVVLATWILCVLMLSGCIGDDESAVVPSDEAADVSATADGPATDDAPTEADDVQADRGTGEPAHQTVTGRFDGHLEHGFRVCQPSTGACNQVRPISDDQEFFIPELTGTLVEGYANLTWDPESPLTQELRLTVWYVPACDGCDLVFLGGTIAPGPIIAELDAPLTLDGGTIWAYARAPYANSAADVYVQNDFEQAFTLDVWARIQV